MFCSSVAEAWNAPVWAYNVICLHWVWVSRGKKTTDVGVSLLFGTEITAEVSNKCLS